MNKSLFKTGLVFLLIASISFSLLAPNLVRANNNKLRVVFVGIKYKNLPPDIQDIITARLNAILDTQKSIILTKPKGAVLTFGHKTTTDLIEYQDKESFLDFARKYRFDHVFSGVLENQSTDTDHILLVGEIDRYDLSEDQVNRFNINKEYAKIVDELNQFKEQYVKPLTKKIGDSGRSPWSTILLGGIIIVSVLSLRFGLSNAFSAGQDDVSTPVDE